MIRLAASERRNKIIQAAVALFSESGFRGTTTRELARKAGISEALLFRHFPDKRRLYQAILSAKMEEQVPLILEDLPASGRPREVLLKIGRRIVAQNEADRTFLRLLLFSALEGHELSDLFFQRRTLPLHDCLKKFFAEGIRSRTFRKEDPDTAARGFLGMIFNFVQMRFLFRIPGVARKPVRQTLETYVDIFLRGMMR